MYTFSGPRGETNIDVTFSRGMGNRLQNWSVEETETFSDHRMINFTVNDITPPRFTIRPLRFRCERAAWDAFSASLGPRVSQAHETLYQGTVHDRAKVLTDIVVSAAEDAIPKSRSNSSLKPPWWSSQLDLFRTTVRHLSRTKNTDPVPYRRARNKYTAALRTAKLNSWRIHCTGKGSTCWGGLYKWLKRTHNIDTIPCAIKKSDGTMASNMVESVDALLETLIPSDKIPTPQCLPCECAFDPVDLPELKCAVWRSNPNKAPGRDLITGKILRHSWPHIDQPFKRLINDCLRTGTFPTPWKNADVVIIPKGRGKDPSLPKSYRPISLLPILGKTLERVICSRITAAITPNLSGRQYGFTKFRSTQDAIRNLLQWHNQAEKKHSLALLLDISGTFDNLDWNALFEDLNHLQCPPSLAHITRSYLYGRTASLSLGGVKRTVTLTKGCPQGSIFGPLHWNVTMERLLLTVLPPCSQIQAYADDIAISIRKSYIFG